MNSLCAPFSASLLITFLKIWNLCCYWDHPALSGIYWTTTLILGFITYFCFRWGEWTYLSELTLIHTMHYPGGLAIYSEYASTFPHRSGAEVVYLEQAYPKPRFLVSIMYATVVILTSWVRAISCQWPLKHWQGEWQNKRLERYHFCAIFPLCLRYSRDHEGPNHRSPRRGLHHCSQ